jgi:hypothetical protein
MTLRWLAALPLIGALALTGCAGIGAQPVLDTFTPRGECLRNGGCWHSEMNYCEPKSP